MVHQQTNIEYVNITAAIDITNAFVSYQSADEDMVQQES
jgi:hypothetical protein